MTYDDTPAGTGALDAKAEQLRRRLAGFDNLAIAFSGGVDSTYLLAAALQALGPARVLALTADSALIPRAEMAEAGEIAASLGAQYVVLALDPLRIPGVVANSPERCYHCKQAVFSALLAEARRRGFTTLAHGVNVDDHGDYRPGQRAAEELGVVAPLDDAGLSKADIRALSRRLALPTWDAPSMACLASRIPYGTCLDEEKLGQVERAEAYLRRHFGLRALRVRHHGPIARLELPPADWPALLEPAARAEILAALAEIGFSSVSIDLAGLQSGSMNRLANVGIKD